MRTVVVDWFFEVNARLQLHTARDNSPGRLVNGPLPHESEDREDKVTIGWHDYNVDRIQVSRGFWRPVLVVNLVHEPEKKAHLTSCALPR